MVCCARRRRRRSCCGSCVGDSLQVAVAKYAIAGPGTVADVAQVGATSPTPGNPRRTNQEPSEGVAPTYVRLTPPISRPAHEFHSPPQRSDEHTSEIPSLMRISYAVFCLTKSHNIHTKTN